MDSHKPLKLAKENKPLRRCVVCRKLAPRESFWRVVRVYPSQQVQLDQGMGRSAYLCQNRECLTLAKRKDRLGRSLKRTVPPEIYHILEERLNQLERIHPNPDDCISDTADS